ncbi:MAG TPA: NAD-dependent epimerase/dehydratase family protein [Chloroflexota bacterium]|nr:NAD-dependent epimerase/dehydratase family protein [Chloroflexota bacterium]
MSRERILITGGAGFVGSHLADALLESGCEVTVYDNLEPQVHGETCRRPGYLNPDVRLVRGDVRCAETLAVPLRRADVVVHLAAMVGVGQSMYQIRRYTEVNAMGAATLLQLLAEDRGAVRKLVVASSMSIYGEGAYDCASCGEVAPRLRTEEQLRRRQWEMCCPSCGAELTPKPTSETKPLFPASVYAITKRDHEEMFLAFGSAYGMPAVALRFFNIYGSRQALSNPYTGAAAIFCSRMMSGHPPLIYEDGLQRRDFVHVSDVVQACCLALQRPEADGQALNVGSGQPLTINEVAGTIAGALGWRGGLEITGKYRAGDIRHCYADISRLTELLGYQPRYTFERGVYELVDWVSQQQRIRDEVVAAVDELATRGLVR